MLIAECVMWNATTQYSLPIIIYLTINAWQTGETDELNGEKKSVHNKYQNGKNSFFDEEEKIPKHDKKYIYWMP